MGIRNLLAALYVPVGEILLLRVLAPAWSPRLSCGEVLRDG